MGSVLVNRFIFWPESSSCWSFWSAWRWALSPIHLLRLLQLWSSLRLIGRSKLLVLHGSLPPPRMLLVLGHLVNGVLEDSLLLDLHGWLLNSLDYAVLPYWLMGRVSLDNCLLNLSSLLHGRCVVDLVSWFPLDTWPPLCLLMHHLLLVSLRWRIEILHEGVADLSLLLAALGSSPLLCVMAATIFRSSYWNIWFNFRASVAWSSARPRSSSSPWFFICDFLVKNRCLLSENLSLLLDLHALQVHWLLSNLLDLSLLVLRFWLNFLDVHSLDRSLLLYRHLFLWSVNSCFWDNFGFLDVVRLWRCLIHSSNLDRLTTTRFLPAFSLFEHIDVLFMNVLCLISAQAEGHATYQTSQSENLIHDNVVNILMSIIDSFNVSS